MSQSFDPSPWNMEGPKLRGATVVASQPYKRARWITRDNINHSGDSECYLWVDRPSFNSNEGNGFLIWDHERYAWGQNNPKVYWPVSAERFDLEAGEIREIVWEK